MAERRVSSQDVAEAAGVSRTTVSFVLNNRPGISIPDSTRQRIWDAASRLGYTPSPEARALKLGRSQIVLCLLPDWPITGPLGVFLELMSAELAKAGFTMLSHQRSRGEDLSTVLAAVTPAAILSICDLDTTEVALTERRGIPLRAFMTEFPGHPDESGLRQVDIGDLQVTTLTELGHTRHVYVLPADPQLDWFSQPRVQGAFAAGERLGVDVQQYRIPENPTTTSAWLRARVSEGVTALAAYNDEVAFALLMAAQEIGLSVPDDISLLGVDDSFISRSTRPTLSTLAFDPGSVVERVASLLLQERPSETSTNDRSATVTAILRESTAAPLSEDLAG